MTFLKEQKITYLINRKKEITFYFNKQLVNIFNNINIRVH